MDKLKEKLDKAEGMLCGLILKELETLNDYNINPKLLSEAGLFYVGIAKKIQELGNEVVDEVNFSSMVENLKLTDKFIAMGGYNTIKELTSIIDVRNSDSIVDEFTKWIYGEIDIPEKSVLITIDDGARSSIAVDM